ncbi:hypothetical protein Taro_003527 [Colocasia esculenta]|uniref:Uncharacterized protein n=1 Tax=Colocasia esculenta TaxID=4460 RepID=A0A843TP86_COLES|nr:hypothetical protein [Colocasia esculenta]
MLDPSAPQVKEGSLFIQLAASPPGEPKFKEEQCFEENAAQKKSGSTRSIRPSTKNKYKEHFAAGAPRIYKSDSSPSKTPEKGTRLQRHQHPLNGAYGAYL